MKTEQFNTIIEEQQKRCVDILVNKAKEYATEDRLHNFKVAAELQMTTPINALVRRHLFYICIDIRTPFVLR